MKRFLNAIAIIGLCLFLSACGDVSSERTGGPTEVNAQTVQPSTVSESKNSPLTNSVDTKKEYHAEIASNDYVSIVLEAIYSDHLEFTVSSKMKNQTISVYLADIALDGLVIPTTYSDTQWTDYQPQETKTAIVNAKIKSVDHKYLSAAFFVFNENNTGESITICEFDLGGQENREYDEPEEKLNYDSDTLSVWYAGADEQGIRFRVYNKMDNLQHVIINTPFYVNGKETRHVPSSISIPPRAITDCYVRADEISFDYSAEDVHSCSGTGYTHNGYTIDQFDVSSETEIEPVQTQPVSTVPEKSSNESKNEKSVAERTYKMLISATKKDLSGEKGKWNYYGIPLLQDDCDWVDNPLNKDGSIRQNAIYRKFAYVLWGSDFDNKRFLYNYKDVSKFLFDYIPDTLDEYIVLAKNAKEFIIKSDSAFEIAKAVMTKIESTGTATGVFDYNNNNYKIQISDISLCAERMQISEEMLGYIFGCFDAMGAKQEFNGNTYSCELKWR